MKRLLIVGALLLTAHCSLFTNEVSAFRYRLHGDRHHDFQNPSRTLYHVVAGQENIKKFRQRATDRRSSWQEKKNIRYEPSQEKLVGYNIDYPKRRLQRAYYNRFFREYLKPAAVIERPRPNATAADLQNFRVTRRNLWIRRMLEAYERLEKTKK